MLRQIALDTETTGLSTQQGHRIIEIGCVEMINRRLTGNTFHYYINPQRKVDPGAMAVHGIRDEFLLDKPTFSDVSSKFLNFIEGAELIIHNAAFDIGFLDYELNLLNSSLSENTVAPKISNYCSVIDTLKVSRQMNPGGKHSLDALCKRYGVDNSKRDLHGALIDAEILLRVYLAMTSGQGALFDQETSLQKNVVANSFAKKRSEERAALKIVYANQDEILADETYFN